MPALPDIQPELESILLDDEGGELELDLPEEFSEADMPILAAEEIIDEGLLGEEDGAMEVIESSFASLSKLKSQAQSTYMMEKTSEVSKGKSRKPAPAQPQTPFAGSSAGGGAKGVKEKSGPTPAPKDRVVSC